MFLPAHGRGLALPIGIKSLLNKRPGVWDLPELPDIGSPIDDFGAISNSQKVSAQLFGAKNCWYGVNGATGLLQAALFSIVKPGQAVLMPRNVHKSIINACLLGDFTPVLFDLPFMSDRGHYLPPNKPWMRKILDELSLRGIKVAAAVLVNPTYHGYSSDIAALIKCIHEFNLPVLVDEAHGTHFLSDLENLLPASALKSGADLVVNSLHKSSIGLSQTSVLWLQGDRIDPFIVNRTIGFFQTSSPNALLLASCEAALREWTSPSGKRKLLFTLEQAKELASQLTNLGIPLLKNNDPLRLILHTAKFGINGFEADAWFISHGLIAELPEPGCLTFCLGFSRHKGVAKFFERKWNQLLEFNKSNEIISNFIAPPIPLILETSLNSSLAWRADSSLVLLNEAVGRISSDLIAPYPPGIPMLIPGEALDQSRVDWLISQKDLWLGQIPTELRVVSTTT